MLSGLRIWRCHELWYSSQTWLESVLLWLWPAAVAPIQPLPWEPPFATGAALKSPLVECDHLSTSGKPEMHQGFRYLDSKLGRLLLPTSKPPLFSRAMLLKQLSCNSRATSMKLVFIIQDSAFSFWTLTLSHSSYHFLNLLFFLFWPPHSIWSCLARNQIQAIVAPYAAAAATPAPYRARLWIESVLALQRRCQSCCTTGGTPKFNFLYICLFPSF